MAKVMASTYRWSETDKDGNVERHVLRPGDDPKDLPSAEVRKDLEKRRLIVDEKRFDKRNGLVLPRGYEVDEEEEPEIPGRTPVRTPSQLAGSIEANEAAKAESKKGSKDSK